VLLPFRLSTTVGYLYPSFSLGSSCVGLLGTTHAVFDVGSVGRALSQLPNYRPLHHHLPAVYVWTYSCHHNHLPLKPTHPKPPFSTTTTAPHEDWATALLIGAKTCGIILK